MAMIEKLKWLAAVIVLSSGVCGCNHRYCQPKDLFSWIDQHCFVADWMNDHSCTSCRYCANNGPPAVVITSRVYDADQYVVPSAASK